MFGRSTKVDVEAEEVEVNTRNSKLVLVSVEFYQINLLCYATKFGAFNVKLTTDVDRDVNVDEQDINIAIHTN